MVALLSRPVITHIPAGRYAYQIEETTAAYWRADGREVQMTVLYPNCYIPVPKLVIVIGTEEEIEFEKYHQILEFSLEETRVLYNHLNRSDVQSLLGVPFRDFPTIPTSIDTRYCPDYTSEICATFERADGRTVEITVTHPDCVNPDPRFIASVGTEEERECDECPQFVTLELTELHVLRDLLNHPEVTALIGA
jgi:hypothetical protein